jgi:hypothetical protein
VTEHRAERGVRDAGELPPQGEAVRRQLVDGRSSCADGAEDEHGVGADRGRRLEVRDRRRAVRPHRIHDPHDECGRVEPRILTGVRELGTEPFGLDEHSPSVGAVSVRGVAASAVAVDPSDPAFVADPYRFLRAQS